MCSGKVWYNRFGDKIISGNLMRTSLMATDWRGNWCPGIMENQRAKFNTTTWEMLYLGKNIFISMQRWKLSHMKWHSRNRTEAMGQRGNHNFTHPTNVYWSSPCQILGWTLGKQWWLEHTFLPPYGSKGHSQEEVKSFLNPQEEEVSLWM